MSARAVFPYLAVALPPLALAAVGVSHPMHLTASSAEYWRNLHIAILPIFPLLGFAPWLIVRGYDAFLSWLVGVLGFGYAAFYTALDVLAGIGAGGLKLHNMGLDNMGMATSTVFGLGSSLGFIGSAAFIAACAIAGLATVRRYGLLTVPGSALAVIGAYVFLKQHIYFPYGVIGQLCIAIGWCAVLFAISRSKERPAPAPRSARS